MNHSCSKSKRLTLESDRRFLEEAERYGDLMGVKALSILETARAPVSVASITKVAKDPPSIA